MGRSIYAVLFVMLGAIVGKAWQCAMVSAIGSRVGFACASLVGLAPFIAALIFLRARYPRHFRFRAVGR